MTRADDGLSILLSELSASSSYRSISTTTHQTTTRPRRQNRHVRNAAGTQHRMGNGRQRLRLHLLNTQRQSKYYPLYRRDPGSESACGQFCRQQFRTILGQCRSLLATPRVCEAIHDRGVTVGGAAGSNPVYLRRLLVVPEGAGAAVRTWRYSGGQRNSLRYR